MNKNTIIKLQVVLLGLAYVVLQVGVYLWLPSVLTLLVIIAFNAVVFAFLLEVLSKATQGD